MKIKFVVVLMLIIFPLTLISGKIYIDKEHKFLLDFPEGWLYERKINPKRLIISTSPDKNAVFFLGIYNDKSDSLTIFYNNMLKEFNAKGDHEFFIFQNREAIFSSLTFILSGVAVQGYFIFIRDKEKYYLLSAYSSEENHSIYNDFLLSILDSFALDESKYLFPGPVSSFYYSKKASNITKVEQNILGKSVILEKDDKEIESSKIPLEREARISLSYVYSLTPYLILYRFYNTVYRDNFTRINQSFGIIKKALDLDNCSKEEKIKRVAKWIQGFVYVRSGTVSDVNPPLEVLFYNKGDCDSRSLLFLLFMKYLDIDAVLLISLEYNHSAVGVDLDTNGAKITFNGKKYLFIELTEIIDIGLVPLDKSDASKWQPMILGY
jgi:hypothetical protein